MATASRLNRASGRKLRRPGEEGTDYPPVALPHRHPEDRRRDQQGDDGVPRLGDQGDRVQPAGARLPLEHRFLHVILLEREEGRRHREHQQVGEDLVPHPDRGGDRKLAHHRDRDQHQGDERHYRRDQRQRPGDHQPREALPRRHLGALPEGEPPDDEVDLLDPVRHADGEHEERNEDRQRVQTVPHQVQRAELPDQGGQGAGDREDREPDRAAVPVHGQARSAAGRSRRTPGPPRRRPRCPRSAWRTR